jgi:hypothetical protein
MVVTHKTTKKMIEIDMCEKERNACCEIRMTISLEKMYESKTRKKMIEIDMCEKERNTLHVYGYQENHKKLVT